MADRQIRPGDLIGGRFALEAPLGKGAFGSVWRALDRQDQDAPVAVKLLFEKYRQDRKMMQRFIQEAKILQHLQHPGIARSLAWDGDGPDPFLAMELIEGETLDLKFEGNSRENSPIPKEGITWIADQLCAAVGYAHKENVVHRDLKPRNVMVNRRGTRPFVKILDFGIAKILVGSEIDPTTVGRVLGSVLYISPEQIFGKPIDHRADVFSLGTIFYELITLKRAWARDEDGRPHPFHRPIAGGEHNSHVAVLRRISREARPKASTERRDLSPAVDKMLAKAMAIKAEDRYGSVEELAQALRMALIEGDAIEVMSRPEELPTLTATDHAPKAASSEAETVRPAGLPPRPGRAASPRPKATSPSSEEPITTGSALAPPETVPVLAPSRNDPASPSASIPSAAPAAFPSDPAPMASARRASPAGLGALFLAAAVLIAVAAYLGLR